jgi:hypothetical protein
MYVEGENKIEKSATQDDTTITVTVVEVENGFVCQKRISGNRGEGEKKEYFEESKTYITTENPFEEESKEKIKLPNIRGLLDTAANLSGKIKAI